MPLANEYLGTTILSGTVFKGKQLGRTIVPHRKHKNRRRL
jgi:hypothetical protein